MITGSCLCGAIAWQAEEATMAVTCHCSMCRKAHGAPFATLISVAESGFRWLRGEEGIQTYHGSETVARAFCGTCGSSVPGDAHDGVRFAPAGLLDGSPDLPDRAEMFTGSRAPWVAIAPGGVQFETAPDGYVVTGVVPRREDPAQAGSVRGSCLCSDVRWRTTEPFGLARYCHCTRCRKARSAACTANAFVSPAGLTFTAGEDGTRTYRVPDARFFAVAFCERCGGGVPRVDHSRGIVIVPMGALDDPPGIAPVEHIFIGSKASWFEITDDLPQHAEGPPA